MYGAFIGDIVGSKYEFNNIITKQFPLFSPGCDYTDDTIMTVAVAKAILLSREEQFNRDENGKGFQEFLIEVMQDFGIPIRQELTAEALLSGSARKIPSPTEAMEMALQCASLPVGWQPLRWKRRWHWRVPAPASHMIIRRVSREQKLSPLRYFWRNAEEQRKRSGST